MTEVWYVSYGSNLLAERFRCYLEGGRAPGAEGPPQPPARDPRPARADEPIAIRHRLVFASRAARWGDAGVAFVDPVADPNTRTLGRGWRIGADQLGDVARGEAGASTVVDADLDRLRAEGRLELHPGSRYGTLVHLGLHPDGRDLVTITCGDLADIGPANPPHSSYRDVITRGLAECWRLDADASTRYLDRSIARGLGSDAR